MQTGLVIRINFTHFFCELALSSRLTQKRFSSQTDTQGRAISTSMTITRSNQQLGYPSTLLLLLSGKAIIESFNLLLVGIRVRPCHGINRITASSTAGPKSLSPLLCKMSWLQSPRSSQSSSLSSAFRPSILIMTWADSNRMATSYRIRHAFCPLNHRVPGLQRRNMISIGKL